MPGVGECKTRKGNKPAVSVSSYEHPASTHRYGDTPMNDPLGTSELPAIRTHCVPKNPSGDGVTAYSGTKEQLVNAGLAAANVFPSKPHWAHSSRKDVPAILNGP
jgi:hypothetical protein